MSASSSRQKKATRTVSAPDYVSSYVFPSSLLTWRHMRMGAYSMMCVSMPRSYMALAASRPSNPPPMTAAALMPLSFWYLIMF